MFFIVLTIICALSLPTAAAAHILVDWLNMADPTLELYLPAIVMCISWLFCLVRLGKIYSIIGSIVILGILLTICGSKEALPIMIYSLLWLLASLELNAWKARKNTA